MTGIDPKAIGAFLSHVDAARTHADTVASELGAITPALDPFDAGVHLVGAQDGLAQLARTLQDARASAAPLDAAETARTVAVDRVRDVRGPLEELQTIFAAGAHETDPAKVTDLAQQAQRAIRRIGAWELDDIATRASDPAGGADAPLGAVAADGTWQPIDASPLAEFERIARAVGDEQADLMGELAGIGRASSDEAGDVMDRLDDDIVADELLRALDSDDAVARFVGSNTSSRAALAADADELARGGMSTSSYREIVERAPAAGGSSALPGQGSNRLLTLMPANMVDLAVVHHANATTAASKLPYKATGAFVSVPTRDEAFELASNRAGHWFVMPHADGSWRVVEAQPHPQLIGRVTSQVRLGTDATGIDQQFGRIDGYFVDGNFRAVSGPSVPLQLRDIVDAAGDAPVGRTAFLLREVGGLEPHAEGIMPRVRVGETATRVVSGAHTDAVVDRAPAAGDVVSVLQYRGADRSVELPMLATGVSALVPTRDAAFRLATSKIASHWAILPDAKAGWHVVEIKAGGSNIERANALIAEGARVSGMRQPAGRVDAYVERGLPTWIGDAPRVSARDLDEALGALVAPGRPVRVDAATIAAPDASLVTITKPGGRKSAETQLALHIDERASATTVAGSREAGVQLLESSARSGPRRGVHALLELEPGRYAVAQLTHEGLDRGAHAALRDAITRGEAPVVHDPRIRAIAAGHGRDVRTLAVTP